MSRQFVRQYWLIALSVVMAGVCVRLGIWQLSRLQERRAHNALVVQRLDAPPVPVDSLPRDTGAIRYRRIAVRGTYDYAHQIVLTSRSRSGSPGVNILTPLRIAGRDTVLLVNRGWVYAADGMRADLSRWREGDSVDATGYALPADPGGRGVSQLSGMSPDYEAFRWFDPPAIQRVLPYPAYPFMLVLAGDSAAEAKVETIPPRVPPPPLDEGPHMSYAFQWFTFATIALAGAMAFVYTRRRSLQ